MDRRCVICRGNIVSLETSVARTPHHRYRRSGRDVAERSAEAGGAPAPAIFASGHTIGSTLLYGQLLLFVLPVLKSKRRQGLAILFAAMLVMLVAFSRIALGAHYLSDVIAAIFLGSLWLMICALLLRARRHDVLAAAVTVSAGEPQSATAAASES